MKTKKPELVTGYIYEGNSKSGVTSRRLITNIKNDTVEYEIVIPNQITEKVYSVKFNTFSNWVSKKIRKSKRF